MTNKIIGKNKGQKFSSSLIIIDRTLFIDFTSKVNVILYSNELLTVSKVAQ